MFVAVSIAECYFLTGGSHAYCLKSSINVNRYIFLAQDIQKKRLEKKIDYLQHPSPPPGKDLSGIGDRVPTCSCILRDYSISRKDRKTSSERNTLGSSILRKTGTHCRYFSRNSIYDYLL